MHTFMDDDARQLGSKHPAVHDKNPPFIVEIPPFMTKTRHSCWVLLLGQ